MRRLTKLRTFIGALVVVFLASIVLPHAVHAGPLERFAQSRIEQALSAPGRTVTVEGLSGNPFSNASIDKIIVADDEGTWLEMDGITGSWRLTTLVRGRLEISSVAIESVNVIRRPQPAPSSDDSSGGGGGPPVAIDLKEMVITDLTLNEAVAGIAAELGMSGSAFISGSQLSANVDVLRKDATGGELKADFDYAPGENTLTADIQLEEPANGLAANLLHLEGRPAISLNVSGTGSLDDWQGNLTFAADQSERFNATARISSNGEDRRLELDGNGDLTDLIPAPYSAALSGPIALDVDGTRTANGAVELTKAMATTDTINLQAAGRLSENMLPVSGAVIAKIQDQGGSKVAVPFVPGGLSLDVLDLSAQLQAGDDAPWMLDLNIAGLTHDQGSLSNLGVSATGTAAEISNPRRRDINADLKASASGLALSDNGLQQALGQSLGLSGKARLQGTDPWQVEDLQLTGETLRATYTGTADDQGLNGKLAAVLQDLSAFAALANRDLSGSATLDADGSATFAGLFSADVDAELSNLAIGTPIVDDILTGTVSLKGSASRAEDGLSFDAVTLTTPDLETTLDGSIKDVLDLTLDGELTDLARLNDKASGAVSFNGSLSGQAAAPSVDLTVTGDDVTLMERPLENARLTANAVTGGPDFGGSAKLTGRLGGVDLDGSATLSGSTENPQVTGLTIKLGDTALTGDVSLNGGLATGDLSFVSLDLSEVSPLLLRDISGSASGMVTLAVTDGKQSIDVTAKADSVASDGLSVGFADLTADVTDAFGEPLLNGSVTAGDLASGSTTIAELNGKASSSAGATDFSLSGVAMDASFSSSGTVGFENGATLIAINDASAARDGLTARLAEPARITISDGGYRFDPITIAAAGGTIVVTANDNDPQNLAIALNSLQASTARTFVPDLDPSGTINGTININGGNQSEPVAFNVTMDNVSAAPIEDAGVPSLSVTASGALKDNFVDLNARIGAQDIDLTINGTVPVTMTDSLNVKVAGALPLSLAEGPVAERGSSIGGALAINVTVTGILRAPKFNGTITTSGASFTDPLTGIAVRDLALNAVLSNDRLTIQSLTARANDNGTINVSGFVGLDPASGLPADVTATIRSGVYNDGNLVSSTFDADLKLTGALLRDALLAGTVTFNETEIRIPESLGGPGQAIAVDHVDPPANVERTLVTIEEHNPSQASSGSQSGIRLNIELSAPNQIFVRGRGLDAELGGNLTLTGFATSPTAVGGFTMRRGRIDILARRIEFTRGIITFDGSLEPRLDLEASTTSSGTVVTIDVEGPASDPEITFSSSPPLPQDEVLAQLLFGQNINDLTTGQAAQLGIAAAELGGIPITSGILGDLRQALGVDDLDVTTDAEGNAAVRLGAHISDNAYIGVEQGSGASSTRVTIDLDITKNIKARGEVGTSESKAGIFFQRDY